MMQVNLFILQKYPKMCAHFYCGNSSNKHFWIPHSPKYKSSMQNTDCQTFYVNWTSVPCALRQTGLRTERRGNISISYIFYELDEYEYIVMKLYCIYCEFKFSIIFHLIHYYYMDNGSVH